MPRSGYTLCPISDLLHLAEDALAPACQPLPALQRSLRRKHVGWLVGVAERVEERLTVALARILTRLVRYHRHDRH